MTMSASMPLVDLAPAAPLLLGAALAAAVLLAGMTWRWRRQGPSAWLAALTAMTLFLTFDLIVFGAFTRLTDSGLGCPDWPGCYGSASPVGASVPIAQAEAAMPSGPVTLSKAWIEMIHRYLAMTVGALILVLAVSVALETVSTAQALESCASAAAGFVFWTAMEYFVHRVLYHHAPYFTQMHNAHHAQPNAIILAPPII